MAWVALNEAYILGAMPSEILGLYNAWVAAHPEKSGRLAEIAASVLGDFRTGLAANPTVVMEDGADTLPARCLEHALTIIFYHLALEMGISVNMSAQTAYINAETYLRVLYKTDAVIDRQSLSQTPSYARPDVNARTV